MVFSKLIFGTYLFSIGLVHAFSLSEKISIPLILACVLLILIPISPVLSRKGIFSNYFPKFSLFSTLLFFRIPAELANQNEMTPYNIIRCLCDLVVFFLISECYFSFTGLLFRNVGGA